MAKESNLKLGGYLAYTPRELAKLPEPVLRQEYNRLRKIALARGSALSRSEFADSAGARRIEGHFQLSASKLTKNELIYELNELATVTTSELTSVRALQRQRRESLATLKEHGYNIGRKDFAAFGRFMEQVREFYGRKNVDSPRAAEVFAIASKRGIPAEELLQNLDYWAEHSEQLKHSRRTNPDGSIRTAEDYRQLFGGIG